MSKTTQIANLKKIGKEQEITLNYFQRFHAHAVQKAEDNVTIGYLEGRLAHIQTTMRYARSLHAELVIGTPEECCEAYPYFAQDAWKHLEDTYDAIEDLISDRINTVHLAHQSPSPIQHSSPLLQTPQPANNSSFAMAQFKYPELDIRPFSGELEDWVSFRDLFKVAVHENGSIPDVQKFIMLSLSLKGEALNLIKALNPTEQNYKNAWTNLCDRYDNNRILISTLLNKLINLPDVNAENLSKLKTLRDTVRGTLDSLENLECPTTDWDPLLIQLIVNKFNNTLKRDWENKISDKKDFPKFEFLEKFILKKIRVLEAMQTPVTNDSKRNQASEKKNVKSHNSAIQANNQSCLLCSQPHLLFACQKFKDLSVDERSKFRIDKKLCANCLAANHKTKECRSSYKCRKCSKPHHTLLHFEKKNTSSSAPATQTNNRPDNASTSQSSLPLPNANSNQNSNTSQSAKNSINTHLNSSIETGSLLATAVVRINNRGRSVAIRSLIDSGSETSFVSESIVQALRLKRTKVNIPVAGIGGDRISTLRYRTQLDIRPNFDSSFRTKVNAYVLPKISSYSPKAFPSETHSELEGLILADPFPSSNLKIDLLLGADVYGKLLIGDIIRLKNSEIIAQSTELGWTLLGPSTNLYPHHSIAVQHGALDLDVALQRLWEQEEVPHVKASSTEDDLCEKYFCDTVQRTETGRFSVRLPFKSIEARDSIGSSKHIAFASWKKLEDRFRKNENLCSDYNEFLSEYEQLGHMTDVTNSPDEKRVFLPHHAVIREQSSTTKTRVVFNASAKTSNGIALNDTLCVGPKLQNEITHILSNWRNFRVVFTADIEKMFRQILIDKSDRKYQCILWRRPGSDIVSTFELNTVTYGTKSAPYIALRVIKEIALRSREEFPLAMTPLLSQIYVDDILYGADKRAQAIEIRDQTIDALKQFGLNLRKWCSNDRDLIPESERSSESVQFDSLEPSEIKVLGISWSAAKDIFVVKVEPISLKIISKRTILSNIAKIFDPMGWFSAVTIRAKILLQSLWLKKVDWDDPIEPRLSEKWVSFCEELSSLMQIQIPRWTGVTESSTRVELVGFCDASIKAYSATVYLRVSDSAGVTKSTLIAAKARVAPLKTLSIPRLELSGAVLLTKLINNIKQALIRKVDNVLCYTDSKIVLDWLSKQPCNWLTFVSNRISFIQTTLPEVKGQHVKTKDNPADLNSRGLKVSELLNSKLWWHGPLDICNDDSSLTLEELNEIKREARPIESLNACTIEPFSLFSKFSSWSRLIRVTAFIFKFIRNCKISKEIRTIGNASELDGELICKARSGIFRYLQTLEFSNELTRLKENLEVLPNSPLKTLSPFLDEDGVIRVGGRLQFTELPFSKKHPIILPQHPVTTSIIRYHHLSSLHGGLQLTLQLVRDEFWIFHVRNTAKAVIKNCVICTRHRAVLEGQKMSPLPAVRCTPSQAFKHCGVDYCGPFLIKYAGGRGQKTHKSYIAIFVCLVTKAIHIEVVSDYSSNAFLAAFKRFVSRRGIPDTMYSDQGTTFKGASAELDRAFGVAIRDENLINAFVAEKINWKFTPPQAPHMGGIWEAGVKSTKVHLKKVMGSFYPTFEEMGTITSQIEACLNSRPLVRLTDDPDDLQVLTPGHFLIGSSLKSVPEKSFLDLNENLLSRWQVVTKIVQNFWKRWSAEYLHTLQVRKKWFVEKPPLKLGDIVLLRDPNNSPCSWPLAKVTKLIPSKDGLIRIVKVKTSKSEFVRPITQLSRLPVDKENLV